MLPVGVVQGSLRPGHVAPPLSRPPCLHACLPACRACCCWRPLWTSASTGSRWCSPQAWMQPGMSSCGCPRLMLRQASSCCLMRRYLLPPPAWASLLRCRCQCPTAAASSGAIASLCCAVLCCDALQGGGISVRRQLVEEASGHHLLLHTGQLEALTCPAAIMHRYCLLQTGPASCCACCLCPFSGCNCRLLQRAASAATRFVPPLPFRQQHLRPCPPPLQRTGRRGATGAGAAAGR